VGEITQRGNEWLERATDAAIKAGRNIVLGDSAAIPMMTPVGRLSDVEWGWIVAAVIFARIATRAEQATAEGYDLEFAIRAGFTPDPWDAGAIATILPKLGDLQINWRKPIADWSREPIIAFLLKVLDLAREAMAARDASEFGILRKPADLNNAIPQR
jgi:hypothetical protein